MAPLRRFAVLGLVALTARVGVAAQARVETPAPRIASVHWHSDIQIPSTVVRFNSSLTPGALLVERDVRRTLRDLYATELFENVEVHRRPAGEGRVDMIIATRGAIRVGSVKLDGVSAWSRARLGRLVEVHPGAPLLEDEVLRTIFQLQDRLIDQGYWSAVVRVEPEIDELKKEADLKFLIDRGQPTRIGAVRIEGDLGPWSEAELVQELGLEPGALAEAGALDVAADRLRDRLVATGWGRAEVDARDLVRISGASTVEAVFDLSLGPRIELEVTGVERKKLEKRDLLPFTADDGWDEASLLRSLELIRDAYQADGHYRVEVERSEKRSDDLWRVELRIEPGPTFELAEVSFDGIGSIDESELRRRMQTTARGLLGRTARLVTSELESDLTNIEAWLARQGWPEVDVQDPVVRATGEELTVTIPIELGPRQWVASLELEGFTEEEREQILSQTPLESGGPFHPLRLDDLVASARAAMEGRGYPDARVAVAEDWNENHTLVDLRVQPIRGARHLSDRIVIAGTYRTDRRLVRRAAALDPGEPISRRALLDAQRRLYDLGIFSRVRVDLAPTSALEREHDIRIRVEEGRNRRLLYGAGWDSESGLGALVGYSDSNLWGRAVHFQVDGRASAEDHRYRLLLRRPQIGTAQPVSLGVSFFQERETRSSFDFDRASALLEVGRTWSRSRGLRTSLSLDYRDVELSNLAIDLDQVDREYRDALILSLVPRVTWDRRDDVLDPTRGWLTTLEAEIARPILGTDQEFDRLFLQQSLFVPLGDWGVFAASLRAGAIEPRGALPVAISERYFGGGRNSHRAYERDRLGIPGQTLTASGEPIGGNGLLLANLEYRFPIWGPIGGTALVDAGNVWADWDDVDPSDVLWGAGVGLRYRSPIGPLRLEIAWKLEREPELEQSAFEVFFSFGHAF